MKTVCHSQDLHTCINPILSQGTTHGQFLRSLNSEISELSHDMYIRRLTDLDRGVISDRNVVNLEEG